MKPLTAIIQADQLARRAFICLAVDPPPLVPELLASGISREKRYLSHKDSLFPKVLALSGFEVIAASLFILFRI